MKNCDRGLKNAFSSPGSQFLTIRTDPKPANNIFIFFFFPAVNWLSSGFVYTQPSHRIGLRAVYKPSQKV